MAGFNFDWPSINVGGEIGGFDVNVIWTPNASGGWSPTVIPGRTGTGTTVIPSTANQMMLIGAAIIGVLLLVLLLKR